MPKQRPTSRKERRDLQKHNYLGGNARRPYSHSPTLTDSLVHDDSDSLDFEDDPTASDGVCSRCLPVLSRYKDVFDGLTHRGTKLKRVKGINPHPKLPERVHYRDLVGQNNWLRENLFDGLGNYLFSCCFLSITCHSGYFLHLLSKYIWLLMFHYKYLYCVYQL